MNIGINTFLFTSPFTDRSTKLFAQFARWGFDCVEISVEQPQHINPAHVKRELEKHSLRPGPVCACFPPDRDLRGTKAQQKNAVDYVCRLVDLAVLLGSLGGPAIADQLGLFGALILFGILRFLSGVALLKWG